MSRYYEYEEQKRSPRRDRDYSPDYHSGGGGGTSNPGRDSGDSFVRETMTLEPPPGHSYSARPRSVPPPDTREIVPRGRSPSPRYYDDDDSRAYSRSPGRSRHNRSRGESPLSRARSAMQDNFTNSTTGIGASLIGAIAGGYAARQVSDRVNDHRRTKDPRGGHRRRSDADKDERMRIASTLLGAAIGGLGANVLTNRFEDSRERERARQDAWEGRYGREEDLPHYDTGRPNDLDHRSGRGLRRRDSDGSENDYVYDRRSEDDRRRSHRRDSDEDYPYRH